MVVRNLTRGRDCPAPIFLIRRSKMSINVSMKKIGIGIVVLLVIAGSFFWWNSDERKAGSESKRMVIFAERQSVEIAIIEQAVRLQQLKTAVRKANVKPIPVNSEIPKEVSDVLKDSDSK